MEPDFKVLSMMELRSSPGDILDRVYKNGEAFIIERNGQQKACLVPITYFAPNIPKDRINSELDALHKNKEEPIIRISNERELEIIFKENIKDIEITIKIILPHGYPNVAPRVYISPINVDAPHRWQDGALCIFGAGISWNPGKHNAVYILELARKWLSNYENWCKAGQWQSK